MKSLMMELLLLFICLSGATAGSQTKRGTVVVVIGFEHGPVSLSADSLEYYRNGNTDKVCKIATPGNKLIVTATNYAGNGKDFSVLAEARNVYASFPQKEVALKNFSSKFVAAWKDSLLNHISHELQVGTVGPSSTDHGVLMNGIVVGLDAKGVITLWLTRIRIEQVADRTVASADEPIAINWLPMFYAGGKPVIAIEVHDGTTPRGRKWREKIAQSASKLPMNEKSTYWTRQLVDLTIDNLPVETIGPREIKTVGGPIDSVTIDRTGIVKWRKYGAECP